MGRSSPEDAAPASSPPDEPHTAAWEGRRVAVNLFGLTFQLTGPLYHALQTRALGPDGYGLYNWGAQLVDVLALFVCFGTELAVRRYAGEAVAKRRPEGVHAAVGSALRLIWSAGLLIGLAMTLMAPAVASWQGEPRLTTTLRLVAWLPLFNHTTTTFIMAAQASHDMKDGLLTRSVVQPLVLWTTMGLALWLRPGTTSVCVALLVTTAATSAVAGLLYHRRYGLRPTVARAARGPLDRRFLGYSRAMVAVGALGLLQSRVGILLVGHLRPAADLGVYVACAYFATSIPQVRAAFDTVVLTRIPVALARGDLDGLGTSVRRQVRWAMLGTTPAFIVFAGFSDVALAALGPRFASGVPVLVTLMTTCLIGNLFLSSSIIPLSGRVRDLLAVTITAVCTELTLLALLLPRHGLIGAAVAASAGGLVSAVGLAFRAWRATGVTPLSTSACAVAGVGMIAIGVGRAAMWRAPGPLAARAAAGLAVAAVVYLPLALRVGLTADERRALLALARRDARAAHPPVGGVR